MLTAVLSVILVLLLLSISKLEQKHWTHTKARTSWLATESMPCELATATIFLNEQDIELQRPVKIRRRVDQVYLTSKGYLVVVDTKTRSSHRVEITDIDQLSIYGAMLNQLFPYPVLAHGYVRTVANGTVQYHRVLLRKISLQA